MEFTPDGTTNELETELVIKLSMAVKIPAVVLSCVSVRQTVRLDILSLLYIFLL